MTATPVAIEAGQRRTFASALHWPGWCRAAKGEKEALAALAACAGRYRPVALAAGEEFDPGAQASALTVVERATGGATTDFGAPEVVAAAEAGAVDDPAEARRLAALVAGTWSVFDAVVAAAPEVLRRGPRGGGRDRDAIVAHVVGAEADYARRLGMRVRPPDPADFGSVAQLRAAVSAALAAGGDPSAETGPGGGKRWPLRYAARRIAWHVLDHAWEIEDRSAPA